jgi:inhibitor of KinA
MITAPTFKTFGLHAVLVNWAPAIRPEVHKTVMEFDQFVTQQFSEDIIETVFAFHSLAIYLHETISAKEFILKLKDTTNDQKEIHKKVNHLIRIPVCYDLEFGYDLAELANFHELSVKEVISLHTQPDYIVYFIGFLPGFPYLGGLDSQLVTPRKDSPRPYIEKGSVGIGGEQTGVYTLDSPGGWNIVGRSPIDLFSMHKQLPAFLQSGDRVRFVSISKKKFNKILSAVEDGSFRLEKEVIDG